MAVLAAVIVIVGTIVGTLLTVTSTLLISSALGVVSALAVIARTIRAALTVVLLQSGAEAFRSESAFVVIVSVVTCSFRIERALLMDARAR